MSKRPVSKRGIATVAAAVALLAAGFVAAPAGAADIEGLAEACSTCHGDRGLPALALTPVIWGQQSNYLYKQLHDFHSGDRSSPMMAPIARNVSLDDLRALANYFAAKAWPSNASGPARQIAGPAAVNAAPPPAAIAAKIEMCKACHQGNFAGGDPGPRLAGLNADYLADQMNAFADGSRANNLDMPGFMRALSASDRAAIAKYLAGL